MRRSWIFIISLALNAVLVLALLAGRRSPRGPAPAANLAAPATNQVRTQVVVRKQFFSWQELESADYPTYIANLRDIACPEQTIRDIIIADVNQLYARKRLAEVPTTDQQWWRSGPDTNVIQAAAAKIVALDQERRALLTTLLGPNWDTPDMVTRPLVALNGPVLGELSPEVKNAVQEIIARSQQRTQAYLEAQKNAGKTADPAALARLGMQTRNELAQVLNPAQMEEFLLRYSQTAADLRTQLTGVDVTPDEFRNLFRVMDPLEQQVQLAGDATSQAAQQAAYAKQLAESLKTLLGADRYQAYRMAQDPAYRDAVNVAEDAGAPADAVPRLYQLNKAYQQEVNSIQNDASLTDQQKADQLKIVEDQQQNAIDQVLGLAPPPETPAPPAPPPPLQVHAYSPGETVDQIATMYGVTPISIFNANPNVNFNNLTRGAPITIPNHQ